MPAPLPVSPSFGRKRPADRTGEDSAALALQALVRQSFAQEAEKARQLKARNAVKLGAFLGLVYVVATWLLPLVQQ